MPESTATSNKHNGGAARKRKKIQGCDISLSAHVRTANQQTGSVTTEKQEQRRGKELLPNGREDPQNMTHKRKRTSSAK